MPSFDDKDRLAIYTHLRTFESDFDKSQSQIRAICAAWSTAVLAAIALVITTAVTPLVVARYATLLPRDVIGTRLDVLVYLRVVICGIGSAGVLAFWYIDQGVYQRLLHSVFAYGMNTEFRNPELPQIRSSLYLANLDVTNRLGTFYRAQFWTFALLSLIINLLSVIIGARPVPDLAWVLAGTHALLVLFWEVRSYHRWPALDANIRDFYPDMADALPLRTREAGWYDTLMEGFGKIFDLDQPPERSLRFADQSDEKLQKMLQRLRHQPPGWRRR